MYQVVLPVDRSIERAERAAKVVSELPQAAEEIAVILLHVVKEFDAIDDSGGIVEAKDMFEDYDPPESMDRVEKYLIERNIKTTRRLEHGDIENTIVDVAEELGANMIVMGGRKRSPAGKLIFGSTTQDVLLQSSIPVFISLD